MTMVLLSSCAVKVKDEPLYLDEGSIGAVEVHFLTPGTTDLNKTQWDAIRPGMVCMPETSFGDFKAELEELCSKTTCTYEMEQALKTLRGVFDVLEMARLAQ